jgi:hypothetical protein
MSESRDLLFAIATPLGFPVRTTPGYWALLQLKHPEIQGRLEEIKRCLAAPEQIRRSKQDPNVYLFYRPLGSYHICVVAKRLNGQGFIVTCYITDAIKEGMLIWPTSG